MARNKDLSSETSQFILRLRNGYSMQDIAKKLKISYNATPFTEQRKLTLTRIERGVEGPGEQLGKSTCTLECLV